MFYCVICHALKLCLSFSNLMHTESIDSIKEPLNGVKNQFHVGMKLEANDRRFPYYVCVATIADVRG